MLLLTLGLLSRVVPWDDSVEVGQGPGMQVGVALERGPTGPALVLPSGVRVPLTEAQARSARERPGLSGLVHRIQPAQLALAVALYGFGIAMVSLRWNRLLALLGVPQRLGSSLLLSYQALTVGLIMPGSVGGDLFRVGGLVSQGQPLGLVTASVLLDRVVGLWLMLMLSGALGLALSGVGPGGVNALLLLAGLGVPVGVAALTVGAERLPAGLRARLPLQALTALAAGTRARPAAWVPILLASLGNFCAQTGCVLSLLAALAPLPAALGTTVVGVSLGFVAWALPLSPGGVGVGEVAFVATLGLSGVATATATGAAVGFRLTCYVVAIAVAPLLLFRASPPSAPSQGPAEGAGLDTP